MSFISIALTTLVGLSIASASNHLLVVSDETDGRQTLLDLNVQPSGMLGRHGDMGASINLDTNSLISAIRNLAPNTFDGVRSDASNSAKFLSSLQDSTTSHFSFNDVNSLIGSALTRGQADAAKILKLAQAIVSNPQLYCANILAETSDQIKSNVNKLGLGLTQTGSKALDQFGQEVESGLTNAGSLANQGAHQSSSFLGSFGSSVFGR